MITPEGEAALDASLEQTGDKPAVVVARELSVREEIPRAVVTESAELARQRWTSR